MMRCKISFFALGVLAMLVSCSANKNILTETLASKNPNIKRVIDIGLNTKSKLFILKLSEIRQAKYR